MRTPQIDLPRGIETGVEQRKLVLEAGQITQWQLPVLAELDLLGRAFGDNLRQTFRQRAATPGPRLAQPRLGGGDIAILRQGAHGSAAGAAVSVRSIQP